MFGAMKEQAGIRTMKKQTEKADTRRRIEGHGIQILEQTGKCRQIRDSNLDIQSDNQTDKKSVRQLNR